MTKILAKSDFFQAGGSRRSIGGPAEAAQRRDIPSFADALLRSLARSDGGPGPGSAGPREKGAPLRPLFSPDERFKILYRDQVILRVLTNIAIKKEV